jgi:hypothetical protein
MSENNELAPTPGMTASQRKQQLDNARFVAVRNLAYMVYKGPNDQPLMTYQQTLEDRELVKTTIIAHEIGKGLIVDDRGAAPAAAPQMMGAPTPQMGGVQGNGVPQAAPQQYAPAGPPQMAPAAAYAAPQMAPAAPPSAQQVAHMGAPQQQEAPAAATTGRKRRTAAGGAPAQAAQPQAAPQQMAPQASPAPIQAPLMTAPGAYVPQAAPAIQAPAQAPQYAPTGGAPAVAGSDLAAIQRLEALVVELGRGLTVISGDLEKMAQRVQLMERNELITSGRLLAALHHMYGAVPSLGPVLAEAKVTNITEFTRHLDRYAGNPS